ncbi:MAG: phenylacetic acid degradation protein PaaN [Actinomycetes bacterium]
MTQTHAPGQTQHPFLAQHAPTLARAVQACAERGFWTPYPESPSPRVYGADAAAAGQAAFEALLDRPFDLAQPGTAGSVATERSPYGMALDVSYPRVRPGTVDALLDAARAGMPAWRDAGPATRAGVALEILARLNVASFTMAHAVMHTTGQPFVMAFQAGGPQAQDRGLEAVAYAYQEMTRVPAVAYWEKPTSRGEPIRTSTTFTVIPRGVGLVIGCTTFPTWNSYPGLFASLVTGNAVVVKPHPGSVLPLALTVRTAREVLAEAGFDPNLVTLAAEDPADRLASVLATRSETAIVDFTGSSAYGQWLQEHARGAVVYTETSGVNTVVVDSTDDLAGMAANIAFSLTLYSGQMCTTPQDIFIPAGGIATESGHRTVDEVVEAISGAIRRLTEDAARAVELLGAVVNDSVLARLETAGTTGRVALASRRIVHPSWPQAVVRTPALVVLEAADEARYASECFGPVSYLVTTGSTQESLAIMTRTVREHGGMTASVYSTDPAVLQSARQAALEAGVALSVNLTDGVYVNQSAAFSDFHGTGANPAANASLTDAAFVTGRFRVVGVRQHVAAPEE